MADTERTRASLISTLGKWVGDWENDFKAPVAGFAPIARDAGTKFKNTARDVYRFANALEEQIKKASPAQIAKYARHYDFR